MNEIIGNGAFVLLGAAISAGASYLAQKNVAKNEAERAKNEAVALQKQAIITDLIAYRFIITGKPIHDATALTKFNVALGSVPAYFSKNKKCLDLYRSFGEKFNSEKFYIMVTALMEDVPMDASMIDKDLLEATPAAISNEPLLPPINIYLSNISPNETPHKS